MEGSSAGVNVFSLFVCSKVGSRQIGNLQWVLEKQVQANIQIIYMEKNIYK